jgi:riboflavin transporter FmnP
VNLYRQIDGLCSGIPNTPRKRRKMMELTAKQERKLMTTKNMVLMAMFGALSGLLMYIQMPVPFAPSFYKLDFCDVPVLIGSFAMGPVAGSVIAALKILISLVLRGTQTAGVGEFSNWVQACSLSIPAALIYQRNKSRKSAMLGIAAGIITMVIIACVTNTYIMLPAYAKAFHMPIDNLIAMGTAVNPHINNLMAFVLLAVAPFNLLKGVLVGLITTLIYKRVSIIIKSA